MSELRFFIFHYFAIALLTLVSYLFGARLLNRFNFESKLEKMCFSMALGMGVLAYLTLFLAQVALLYRSVAVLSLLIGVAFCYPIWIQWPRRLSFLRQQVRDFIRTPRTLLISLATAALIFALSIPIWFLPLYPPVASDETMYHLPVAKQYIQNHQVVFATYLRYPVFPQTSEMLSTLAMLLQDDVLAHLFQLLLMLILTIALAAFGARFFSNRAGWWSAAILLSNPLVIWTGTVSYVEMALMLFVSMTFYAFWNWWHTRSPRWLILSGVFCGLAIGTKYPPLFFLIVLQFAALYIGFKQRKHLRSLSFGLIAFVVSGPWFVRNFYYMRNPVFPYLYKPFVFFFGVGRLNPEDFAGMTRELSAYGVGKSLLSLVMLPWHLSFNQSPFVMEAPLSPIYLFLPVLLLCCIVIRGIRPLVALIVAYTLFWFFTAQILRYVLPAVPLLSLATGATLDYFFPRVPYVRRLNSYKAITVLGFAILVFPGWIYAKRTMKNNGRPPATQPQRDAYLTARLPSYPAYQLLNKLKNTNYKLYAYNDANMNYFAQGVFMGDWFGPAKYELIDSSVTSGQRLYNQLKALGADYFLLRSERWPGHLPNDEFFKRHFRLIYAQADVSLYGISEQAFELRTVELLQNPGFEQLNQNQLIGWMTTGKPLVDQSGRNSATGSVSIRCNGAADVLFQSVTVTAGGSYTLSSQARGVTKDEPAKLQVNWLDAQGRILKEEIKVIKTESEWKRYEKNVIAPEQATEAIIYVDGLDHGSVWLDDISFSQVTFVPQS